MRESTALKERHAATLSPERAELARRIEARDAGAARLEALRSNESRGAITARQCVDAATVALREAIADDNEAVTEGLIAGLPAPAPTAPAARAALAEAEQALGAAQAARGAIRQEIDDLTRTAENREHRVAEAVAEVLQAEASRAKDALVAEIEAAREALIEKAAALRSLRRALPWTPGYTPEHSLLDSVEGMWRLMPARPGVQRVPTDPWAAVVEKLKTDPAAELPR